MISLKKIVCFRRQSVFHSGLEMVTKETAQHHQQAYRIRNLVGSQEMLIERKRRREGKKEKKGGMVEGGKMSFFLLEKNIMMVNFMSTQLGLGSQMFGQSLL